MNILRWKQLKEKVPLSRSTVYRLMSNGDFPKKVRLSKACTGWIDEEVDEWLLARVRTTDMAEGHDEIT